jgi:Integrase zinc binding domain/Integrase core domain
MGKYLVGLERPSGWSDEDFKKLRRKAFKYFVWRGYLYRRNKPGYPPRRVLGTKEDRREALEASHEASGHRGPDTTFARLMERYFWDGMYEDLRKYVAACEAYQKRSKVRYEEPLHPTFSSFCFEKIDVDVVVMPISGGYRYIIFARDDFSGWVEGMALKKATAANRAKFLYECVILRHSCPENIVFDNGAENGEEVREMLEAFGVNKVRISSYHPQSNSLVERGHAPIKNALSKYTCEFGRVREDLS